MKNAQIKVIFTRSEQIGSKFLQWAQRSKWSHVEILFDDYIIGARSTKGVQRYTLESVSKDHEVGVINCTAAAAKKFKEFMESHVGDKYDWRAYLGFVFYYNSHSSDKWFCSELIQEGLKYANIEVINNTESMYCMPRDFWISTRVHSTGKTIDKF